MIDWNAPKEVGEYKYKIIRSGQPRPYADSVLEVEVYLTEGLTKEEASAIVKSMNIGYDDATDKPWWESKLSYFVETKPGVWTFKMVSAYTG